MQRVAYSSSHALFELSAAALMHYAKLKGLTDVPVSAITIERNDPALIQTIEELGPEANGAGCHIQIATIPQHHSYRIENFQGGEMIVEILPTCS